MVFDIGRICFKIAGRDANKFCVVINKIDNTFVEIDGQTRRRKCNINHLEPLDATVDIKAGAKNKEVAEALTKAGFETKEKTNTIKKVGPKPTKQKVKVTNVVGDEKPSKKTSEAQAKKTEAKKETKTKSKKETTN